MKQNLINVIKNLKDYISLIVIAVGLVSNIAISQYQNGVQEARIAKLENERDVWLKMQAKQDDLIKTVEENKNDTKEIYKLVYTIYSNRNN